MQMKSLFFCKGKISNIEVLNQFFRRRHADILGQVIILMKSTIFVGSKSHQRLAHVAHLLGFNIGRLHLNIFFKYDWHYFIFYNTWMIHIIILKVVQNWCTNFKMQQRNYIFYNNQSQIKLYVHRTSKNTGSFFNGISSNRQKCTTNAMSYCLHLKK